MKVDAAAVSGIQVTDASLTDVFLAGRFTDTGVVTVQVGSNDATFHVHRSLLTDESTFFASTLDGNFKEAVENEVKLPEEEPETFEHFVQWLYHGLPDKRATVPNYPTHAARVKKIVDLYVLADKIGCRALRDDVVSEFYHLVQGHLCGFPYASIYLIYDAPITIVPLRRIVVAYFAWISGPAGLQNAPNFEKVLDTLPEFAKQVLLAMIGRYATGGTETPFKKGVEHFLDKE